MLKNSLTIIFAFLLLFATSCELEVLDTNHAEQIKGTYTMTSYLTGSGESDPSSNDKIVVDRIDDATVDITIDYASPFSNDVSINNVAIFGSNGSYRLERFFSNAEISGNVEDNELSIRIDYEDETFVQIEATKDL